MRILYSILLTVLSVNCFAQQSTTLPMENEKVVYEEIIEAKGSSKNELYDNAKLCFVRIFNNANSVIQLDDKNEGHIVGKGYFELQYGSYWDIGVKIMKVYFVCEVSVKEEKLRIRLYDFSLKICDYKKPLDCHSDNIEKLVLSNKKRDIKIVPLFDSENRRTITQFKTGILNNVSSKKDW